MPFISIPMKPREWLLTNARELREAERTKNEYQANRLHTECDGFFAALRCIYPTEVVGMLVMDYDEVLESGVADDETFTASLPRLI